MSFFQLSFQEWLRRNTTINWASLPHHLPWRVYFPFTRWKLWLARNERIFKTQSRSQYSLIFSSVQTATKFHFLASTTKRPSVQVPQLVSWLAPLYPYFKLNIDGSALDNSGLAGARGVLRNHQAQWITRFSAWVGLATNNMAELAAVRQGLTIAWNIGVKFLQLELDLKVVLIWLINKNMNYPTNMLPLICDCKNLLEQDWEVHMHHMYCEANGCVDALAKRGTCQRNRTTVYNECPTFAYVLYVRDVCGLREPRLCAPGPDVGIV